MDPLWITYAWKDDEGGDFSWVVQELEALGITVIYDKRALIPGRHLWDQIGSKIRRSPLSGCAFLLTPDSLNRPGCKEELEYALIRTLKAKGETFPLIGLLHGVGLDDLPPALEARLCVDLGSPDWKEEVLAGLENRPPDRDSQPQTRYVWQVHHGYGGDPSCVAIEARPRFGAMTGWRILIPISSEAAAWGWGPAGGGAISMTRTTAITGTDTLSDGTECKFMGAADQLSPSVSAYVLFQGQLPRFVGFGPQAGPFERVEFNA